MKNFLFAAALSLALFVSDSASAQGHRHDRGRSNDYGYNRGDYNQGRGYHRGHRHHRPSRWEMDRRRQQRYRMMMARRHRNHVRWNGRPVRGCEICYHAPRRW